MKTKLTNLAVGIALAAGITACQSTKSNFVIEHQGDTLTIVHITNPSQYLLLPIQESSNEGQVKLDTKHAADTYMDIRLATDSIQYYVPFALPKGAKEATIAIKKVAANAVCWDHIQLSDTFDTANRDKFRPIYHHTPAYGWMNDANGLVYKDGEYHLYFQSNPYGSVWGNMHWGHSVSKDLLHWQHLEPAIARDTLGHIFSGSTVIDKTNSAGYGANAMVAFYTSASDKNGQIQCMAYSTDNGRTYTKYDKNPVLRPTDGLRDFRDPKVFWYAPEQKWVMIVSADKEMRFYESRNMKDWNYMSAFGEGYGVQPRQFECPDMVELPVEGDVNRKKWALIVNVNPGCYFGGSGTQYFVGQFDGTKFTCDTPKETVKWLDWGKDHYATVCFSNTDNRTVAVPWMSNWQYCNIVPTLQFRSANALPRELGLYTQNGETYLSAAPVAETAGLRKETHQLPAFTVEKDYPINSLLSNNEGAYELSMEFSAGKAEIMGFTLFNDKGEKVDIYFNLPEKKLVMDRTQSGIVDFGKNSVPHPIEAHDRRKTTSINYLNDFALATWAPIQKEGSYKLDIFVDKCSVEIFLDGGKMTITNLVFPTEPYNRLNFYSKGAPYQVTSCTVYRLGL